MNLLKKNNLGLLSIFVFYFFVTSGFSQFKIPEKPSFQTSVYDYANVLSSNEKAQLEEKLIKYADSTTTQIVVITIESLDGEEINNLATNWGQTWGIGGTEKDDNGVIVLLSKKERKIAINPGYGLEDKLTAGIGGEIIRNVIVPEFKNGSYYKGLDKGTDELFKVFAGKYKGERKKNKGKFPFLPIIIFIVIIIIVLKNKNNNGNSGNSGGIGPNLLDVILLSSLGRGSGGGGFGGSSGDGGGFGGGFGGGGFSGGGSSGSW